MPCITLDYGAADPLVLEVRGDALVADRRGPEGLVGAEAARLVTAAVGDASHGPPLESQVVAGDRVTIGLIGDVPQPEAVVSALAARLDAAGVGSACLSLVVSPPLEAAVTPVGGLAGIGERSSFDPAMESQTSYMAADEAGRPIHLARPLVDADVVVGVGRWSWDAALGGPSIEGELWPTFSRQACRDDQVRALARRGRRAVPDWDAANRHATWQLGTCASLRLVSGRRDSLAAAAFGLPVEAARSARRQAAGWRPTVPSTAALAIASLSRPDGGLPLVLRAVAAAARVTHPTGTVCIASRLAERPGVIFTRWREGAPLDALVREALASGDMTLVRDAFQTRFFARALGDRRLVLLSDLDEATVEELELGHAATPEVVERLAHRAETVTVLHEADRMLPRLA